MATVHLNDPWKDPRTGILYFRKRIPKRFKAVAGRSGDTIKISLGTSDRKLIAKPWAAAQNRWLEFEAEWERRLNVVSLTPERGAEIAARWAAWIAGGALLKQGGENSDIFDLIDLPEEATPENVARMWDRVEFHADEALRLSGVEATPESRTMFVQGMRDVVRAAYLDADLKALGMRGHADVEPLQTTRAALPAFAGDPATRQATAPAVSLNRLFEGWRATAAVKPRTVVEAQSSLSIFIAHLGHEDAGKVTRADLAAWRDASKAAGLTNNTFNNRLSHLRNVFEWGVREGLLHANPADAKLRLPKSKAAVRLPYSDAETVKILQAARKESRASLRWVPWILAFSGMRAGEAFQLSVSDLRHEGGVAYFAVHEDDEGKSVKSGVRRNVPIHSALIREGLLDYAWSLPDQSGPLFPDKKADPHGNRGGRAWTVTGVWVRRTLGMTDKQKAPNHSFRHRLEDEMRAVEVPEDARDAIVGHARKTTGRQYGVRGESLKRLQRELEKVRPPTCLFDGNAE